MYCEGCLGRVLSRCYQAILPHVFLISIISINCLLLLKLVMDFVHPELWKMNNHKQPSRKHWCKAWAFTVLCWGICDVYSCTTEFVLCLDASDAFLKDRVMNLPERQVQEHNYGQEHFLRRLATYRESNMEDITVVNYFEELDISPLYLGNPWSRTTSCVWEGFMSWLVCSAFSTLTLSFHPVRDHQQQRTWLPAADAEDLPHGGQAQELRARHPGGGERAEEEGWGEDEERGHGASWGGEQGGRGGQAKGCTLGGVGRYWEGSWDLFGEG